MRDRSYRDIHQFRLEHEVFVAMIGLLFISASFFSPRCFGDDVVAPLNDEKSFSSASADADNLFVSPPNGVTVTAQHAREIEGDKASRISVVNTPGTGPANVKVANVILRSGESLYIVAGNQSSNGGGGAGAPATQPSWASKYNNGSARVLIIPGYKGIFIYDPPYGGITVTIAGAAVGANYTVTLSASGAPDASFPQLNAANPQITLNGLAPAQTQVEGVSPARFKTTGVVTITGADQPDNLLSGTATGKIEDLAGVIWAETSICSPNWIAGKPHRMANWDPASIAQLHAARVDIGLAVLNILVTGANNSYAAPQRLQGAASPPIQANWADALSAAAEAMADLNSSNDPTAGATHYFLRQGAGAPNWAAGVAPTTTCGPFYVFPGGDVTPGSAGYVDFWNDIH